MKLMVTALLESVSGIINVAIVILMIWLMFAILGMNLLSEKLHFCTLPSNPSFNPYNVTQE
jgi:hypothetical protein